MSTQFFEPSTQPVPDPDLDFAGRVVVYLEKSGLDTDQVVDCLMDEFELDHETAVELASLAA